MFDDKETYSSEQISCYDHGWWSDVWDFKTFMNSCKLCYKFSVASTIVPRFVGVGKLIYFLRDSLGE